MVNIWSQEKRPTANRSTTSTPNYTWGFWLGGEIPKRRNFSTGIRICSIIRLGLVRRTHCIPHVSRADTKAGFPTVFPPPRKIRGFFDMWFEFRVLNGDNQTPFFNSLRNKLDVFEVWGIGLAELQKRIQLKIHMCCTGPFLQYGVLLNLSE